MVARNVLARIGIHIPMATGKIGKLRRLRPNPSTGGNRRRASRDANPKSYIVRRPARKIPGLTVPRLGLSKGNPRVSPSLARLWWMYRARRPPRLRPADAGAGQIASVYLREAQAYMLISMPTCTSTIFGVFQVIGGLPLVLAAVLTPRLKVRRVREQRKCGTRQSSSGGLIQQPIFHSWTRIISLSGKALRDTHIDRAPEAFAPSGSRPLFQQAQQRFPGAAV